jgi:hypothetical protein
LQVSGSTGSPDSCEPGKTVLECEQEALLSLNNKVALSGVALNVGLVTTFESDADAVDLDPTTSGVQVLAPPSGMILFGEEEKEFYFKATY